MKQVAKALLVSTVILVGVSTAGEVLSQEAATKTHSVSVLASFRMGGRHVVKLVEYAPGLTGVVESGIPALGSALTPELGKASMAELYRHFAGKSAKVPALVLAADARTADVARASVGRLKSPPTGPVPIEGQPSFSDGIHTYTYDEIYNWFYPIYCEQYGAKDCQLNYDGGWSMTPPVSYSSACFFVGSEGYNAASIEGLYWDWDYSTWIPVIDDNVDPGWAWCYSMNGGSASYYLGWAMWGAGYDTTVGLSVYY